MSSPNASKISDQAFWDAIDPLDYGYLDGTVSGDDQGIDVWLGSGVAQWATAVVCTIDLWKRDMEIKLLLGCNDAEIATISAFLNNAYQHAVVLQVRHRAT